MRVWAMIPVLWWLSISCMSAMDYKGPIEPQTQSMLTVIPVDITHKWLLMDTSWATVHAVLALQQTCRLWHSLLDQAQKKKMVSIWIRNGEDFDENMCLCRAVQGTNYGAYGTPEMFLLAGADVNYNNEFGDSVLMHAVDSDYPSTPHIRLLIKKGAFINYQNSDGDTALHVATCNPCLHCVEILLLNGAYKTLTNLKGKTPLSASMNITQNVTQGGHIRRNGLRAAWCSSQELNRIESLLKELMTPEESIANPIEGRQNNNNQVF